MFYVGAYTNFAGRDAEHAITVKDLSKLGHSLGRAERYLKERPRKDSDANTPYRAVVFVMHNGFVLRNDAIREVVKTKKCDWNTAKFHIYAMMASNILATRSEWPEAAKPADVAEPVAQ